MASWESYSLCTWGIHTISGAALGHGPQAHLKVTDHGITVLWKDGGLGRVTQGSRLCHQRAEVCQPPRTAGLALVPIPDTQPHTVGTPGANWSPCFSKGHVQSQAVYSRRDSFAHQHFSIQKQLRSVLHYVTLMHQRIAAPRELGPKCQLHPQVVITILTFPTFPNPPNQDRGARQPRVVRC